MPQIRFSDDDASFFIKYIATFFSSGTKLEADTANTRAKFFTRENTYLVFALNSNNVIISY